MKRVRNFLSLWLCLAILPVAMLLAGMSAQGMAVAGTTSVVICSDGVMKTVQIAPQDDTGHGIQDCGDCPACIVPLPVGHAQAVKPARPTDWLPFIHPQTVTAIVLPHRSSGPLSRGPSIPSLWLNA